MTTDPDADVYRVLQVDPGAHQVVIRAAYMALARRFHPDGDAPDPRRMAALNHAYELVRDEQRRRLYDARRAVLGSQQPGAATPVGPGMGSAQATPMGPGNGLGAGSPVYAQAVPAAAAAAAGSAGSGGTFSRSRARTAEAAESRRLDFGRYAGWSLRDLARHDPDYLRWLSRHSSGLRFRAEILRLLPGDPDLPSGNRGARGF